MQARWRVERVGDGVELYMVGMALLIINISTYYSQLYRSLLENKTHSLILPTEMF
jgi:hypothetical protein